MGFNKLEKAEKAEKAEKVKDNKLLAVMTTVLVALLLISQLSLASGNINSRYILDTNFNALEIDESETNDVDVYTPDFLHAIQDQELYIVLQRSDYDLSLVYVEHYIHSGSIRSPLFVS